MNKIKAFSYGIISAFGATFFQQIILILFNVETIDTSRLTPLLIFGAFSEEIFKFIFIYKLAKEEESRKKIILNSCLIGISFSLVELLFKLWGMQNIKIDYFSYFGIFIIHILTAGIMGYFLTLKKGSAAFLVLGITVAVLIHLAYNALLIYLF